MSDFEVPNYRRWYFTWCSAENSTQGGSLVLSSKTDEFPLAEAHKLLRAEHKMVCLVSFWSLIPEAEYHAFNEFCRQNGHGEMGRKVRHLAPIPDGKGDPA